MEIFLIVLAIICAIGIPFSMYMLNRNEEVAALQLALVELSFRVLESYLKSLKDDSELDLEYYEKLCKYRDEICGISYDKMLWSFRRPLEIEDWLNDEQIEFLKLRF